MKKILVAFLMVPFVLCAQQKDKPAFSLCNLSEPVAFADFKSCKKIVSSAPEVIVMSFELIFNSVQGMAIYKMGGDTFDANLMDLLEKGKAKELHLNITTYENKLEKTYRDVVILLRHDPKK
jgi:hypothetical protein